MNGFETIVVDLVPIVVVVASHEGYDRCPCLFVVVLAVVVVVVDDFVSCLPRLVA